MGKQNKDKSGLVTAGLVLAIIGIALSAVPIVNNVAFVLSVLGLIFGIVGLVKSRRRSGKQSNGKAIATIIIAAVGIVIVIASQAMYGKVLDDVSKEVDEAAAELDETINKATGDATEELLENDVTVELGTFTISEQDYYTETSLPITVTNKNAEAKTYSVQIEAVDANGQRVADYTVYTNNLGSGQTENLKAFEYVESEKVEALKTATFKIVSVSQM